MTVAELIKELEECPKDREVVVPNDYGNDPVTGVVCGDEGPVEITA